MIRIALATVALSALASALPTPGQFSLEEKLLATIPDDLKLEGEPLVSPDGQVFEQIQPVVWSPDGTQVAYSGLRGEKLVPVLGDRVLGEYHYANAPIFGASGEQVLFRVGNRKRSGKSEEWWLLTGAGESVLEEDWIGTPVFSPDGTRFATWTQPGAKIAKDGSYTRGSMVFLVGIQQKGKWKLSKGKKYEDASALKPPSFNSDGSVTATVASKDQSWFVLTSNGKKEKPFDKQEFSFVADMAISPNGKQVALAVMDENSGGMAGIGAPPGMTLPGSKSVIVHGKDVWGREYDNVGVPVFAPDGKHLAYKVKRGEKMGIALDGDKSAETNWDYVFTPVFSPDGKSFCYAGNLGGKPAPYYGLFAEGDAFQVGGKCVLVLEDSARRKKPETVSDEYLEIRNITFGPDGERITFCAKTEKGWIAVSGKTKSDPFDEVGPPHISADGKQLAFGARRDRELWWKVLPLE